MRDKKGHRIVPYPDFSLHELCEKNIWMGSLNFASFLETFPYPSINVFPLIPENTLPWSFNLDLAESTTINYRKTYIKEKLDRKKILKKLRIKLPYFVSVILQVIKDIHLFGMIFVFLFVDIVIIIIWSAVDPLRKDKKYLEDKVGISWFLQERMKLRDLISHMGI